MDCLKILLIQILKNSARTFANDLYQKLGCIVIDVASLSIEETASMILNALNLEDHSYYSTETSED